MPTFDVVLHTNDAMFEENFRKLSVSFPPLQDRVEIGVGLWMGQLEGALAETLLDTCEPKILGIQPPARQDAQMYAYVRELHDNAELYRWDNDYRLSRLVAMSRLIHPTSVGFRYAGRVRQDDQRLIIVPAQLHGISADVYLSPNQQRNWLSASEAKLLAELDAKSEPLITPAFPNRVSRALWYFDYAQRTYYADLRWMLVATALEALVHTGKEGPTRHFKKRVPALGAEVGAKPLTTDEADLAYDFRSRLSHGDGFLFSMPSADIALYDKLEETLRLAILKAFMEPAFASVFTDDAKIEARFPA